MDGIIIIAIIFVLYKFLDDALTQFMLSLVIIGIVMHSSAFITASSVPNILYEAFLSIMYLASLGKFFYLMKSKGVGTNE